MNDSSTWYSQIIKPHWSPPAWLFGPVWTFLYVLIAISFGKVFWMFFKKEAQKEKSRSLHPKNPSLQR